jgi:molybdopterin/thiamine biosynthesis adenylyltransferase
VRNDGLSLSLSDLDEDRFSRFRLIAWWDQRRLQTANVLVIGAGALGNEILKNLALLGFRRIVVVDIDSIEESNLSRTVLFRPNDIGRSKAVAAAAACESLGRDAVVHAIHADVLSQIGVGMFGWADVILAGLDNREARLWINRCAWKMNRPWIDGAIEGINGVARVFLPAQPPCYECTLGETDWALLEKRLSCNLLSRDEMLQGKTPTTPTTASIVAGIQVQEAVKLLHGLPVLAGRAFIFEGLHHTSYVTSYTENPDCMSHDSFAEQIDFPGKSAETTLSQLYDFAKQKLSSPEVVLEFSRDVIHQLVCPRCGSQEEVFAPIGTVSAAQGRCKTDGTMREVVTVHNFTGTESFGSRTLSQMGLPPFDLFVARTNDREVSLLIEGDRGEVLGALAPFKPRVWAELLARTALQTDRDFVEVSNG